jgi:hypothetical protein
MQRVNERLYACSPRMLTDVGGIPAHGTLRSEWEADCRFDFDNRDYR